MSYTQRGYLFWIVVTLTTVLSVAVGLADTFVIPEYVSLINEVGVELPSRALIIINYHLLWWPTLIVLMLLVILWKSRLSHNGYSRYLLSGFLILAFIEIAIIMVILFSPGNMCQQEVI